MPRLSRALPSRRDFAGRFLRALAFGLLLVGVSLAIGMLGYRAFEGMAWVDAFANSAMILSGMGPLQPLATPAGKVFAGLYAIYSGLALISIAGIMFAPVVHRFLHRFHLEND
jgi:hypothetical protein